MTRLGTNGDIVPSALILPKTNFTFTEEGFRAVMEQVNRMAAANGGQIPVNDPLTYLTLGLLLHRMVRIEAKIDALHVAKAIIP